MKVAIMQPYFLPYIGYFQLISSADHFVFLDDVNYIKKGWINRNRMWGHKDPLVFTIPLNGVSQNKKINELHVSSDMLWRSKFLKQIEFTYRKAPFFDPTFELVSQIIHTEKALISDLNIYSIQEIYRYLGINLIASKSSELNLDQDLKAQQKIRNICDHLGATYYINPIGGAQLYEKSYFQESGIALQFLQSGIMGYKQGSDEFHPNLSILDVLMFNSTTEIHQMLKNFTLSESD